MKKFKKLIITLCVASVIVSPIQSYAISETSMAGLTAPTNMAISKLIPLQPLIRAIELLFKPHPTVDENSRFAKDDSAEAWLDSVTSSPTINNSSISQYQKLKYTAIFVANYLDLNEKVEDNSLEIIREKKEASSEGYSILASELLTRLGIENRIITENKYSWNQIKQFDEWVDIDMAQVESQLKQGLTVEEQLDKLLK